MSNLEAAFPPDRARRRRHAAAFQATRFQRMNANFNPLAFFFGPVYFAIKGMWKPALSYLGCALAVVAVLSALGLDRHIQSVGIGLAVAFSMRANVNYYSKKVLGIDRWF